VPTSDALLTVDGLEVSFRTDYGIVDAVRGVSWSVSGGETLVIVGESGSGKSVSVTAVAGLLPSNATVTGDIRFQGIDPLALKGKALRRYRAEKVGMVFQDPLTALNPCFKVGDQLAEIFRVHRGLGRKEAWAEAVRLLDAVQIRDPERRAHLYPHELSGGMRQRAVIAMAIALEPPLLLADEPTTALDTSVRGEILRIINSLRTGMGMGVVLITHDVGVAAAVADRVAVMYAGEIVEFGSAGDVFHQPSHPYTRALLASMPRLGSDARLEAITGVPPAHGQFPTGCSFHPRCPMATDLCAAETPGLEPVAGTTAAAACHYAGPREAART
jgi:oligopeptide/dipeptide ABC transporter ATP-binding protein